VKRKLAQGVEARNVFAIIQSGGRQVKVGPGGSVTVDLLSAEPGQEVTFDQVLFVGKDGGDVVVGAPFVAGARVVGVVDGEARGPRSASSEDARKGLSPHQRAPEHPDPRDGQGHPGLDGSGSSHGT
jgi:large subunit ribosomal protein L21